jgi:prepilin-type N-terminal cleavage/methylation domain-containing protein
MMKPRQPVSLEGFSQVGGRRGFTLIEIMIVVSILAVVLAMGAPSMIQSLKKEGLRKAQSDLMEACSHARAQAILSGGPMELTIRAEGGGVSVEPLKLPDAMKRDTPPESADDPARNKGYTPQNFSARLEDDIAIRLLYVNFLDQMEKPEARVRFFPDGTSDEFTLIFFSTQGERKLSLDVVTGLASLEVIR